MEHTRTPCLLLYLTLFILPSFVFSGLFFNDYSTPKIFNEEDTMGWNEKSRLIFLSEDLLRTSVLKLRQIVEIRRDHEKKVAYAVGMIMGRIREKYRYMLEMYRDIVTAYNNFTIARTPGAPFYRPFHFIITLEKMHYMEVEIDKLVDVLIDEVTEDMTKNRIIAGESERVRKHRGGNRTNMTTPKSFGFTTSPPLGGAVNRRMQEAEKSLIRQRFLMRKLGNPINMTTLKKRFLRRWPVEGSWSLDKYNQNY